MSKELTKSDYTSTAWVFIWLHMQIHTPMCITTTYYNLTTRINNGQEKLRLHINYMGPHITTYADPYTSTLR